MKMFTLPLARDRIQEGLNWVKMLSVYAEGFHRASESRPLAWPSWVDLRPSIEAGRECLSQFAQLGRLAQYAVHMRRNVAIGN